MLARNLASINNTVGAISHSQRGSRFHVLESFFHVNKIYYNRMIQEIEWKKKEPSTMEEGSHRNRLKNLIKLNLMQLPLNRELSVVPISPMAKKQLKAKLEWFLEEMQNKTFLKER